MSCSGKVVGDRIILEGECSEIIEKGYGEKHEEGYVLSLFEGLYLLEKGKIKLYDEVGNELTFESLLKKGMSSDKLFYLKYVVFRDVRNRGYVIKTGFKFGSHFRVYPRGKKPGEAHTEYVINVIPEEKILEPSDISRMVRLSRAIRTKLVLAMVDSENDVVYYKIERINL